MIASEPNYMDHSFADGTPISLHPVQTESPFRKHAHTFYEITYIDGGHGTLHLAGETRPVSKGDLVFIPYGHEHVILPSGESGDTPLRLMNCLFDKQVLAVPGDPLHNPIYEDLHGLARVFRESTDCIQVREHTKEFARIMYALEMEQKCKGTGFRYKLYLYLIDLLTRIHQAKDAAAAPSAQALSNPVQYAIDDMTLHYQNPLAVEDLCREFLISPRHFQRKFKEATGTTYTKMLQDIRIHRSCELLMDTDWSVQTIALEVGVHDMKHFYRLFKERCGVTPHDFRCQAQPKNSVSPGLM
ncbi:MULTISPECIES: AraC family transcriptional regulator [Paenibacillus]|uniref:AraC family transcriptional regulator n=1 Tax=Paenibacillus TaxID=44249 RepID=UPI0022B90555|nr:AraC family transcriptional regulator [Paenibacillus caseinilyticus]MCZ8517901.1 AraC family transcriptional regulator [Paenibacillus caseinilyticus]